MIDPGLFFRLVTVVTLTGGTVFLMWLGEQITARGVGNGISLIIFAGIVANLPHALARTLELGRTGAISSSSSISSADRRSRVIAFIVFMERAQRRILVQYPKRQVGQPHVRRRGLASAAEAQHLGRDPADLRLLAAAAAGDGREFRGARQSSGWMQWSPRYLGHGPPLYMALYVGLIVFFASSTPRSCSTRRRPPTI